MNDADVSKQIQQMVRFIRQEAEEKANEISVSAEEEFNIEKLQLVEAEKKKIRQEYERKEKQVEVRRKIEYSMQLNASRIKVLQAQDDVVNSMKDAAAKELLNVSHDHHVYRKLLKELIVQSLLRLKEPAVLLRCRKEDLNHVEHVVHSAKEEYADKAKVHAPEIVVDSIYLPAAPSHHNAHGPFCSGGVVLASRDGKIVFENSLDARLDVVFRKKLPEIRKQLFGQVTTCGFRVDDHSDSHLKPTGAHSCGFLMTTSLVMGLDGYGASSGGSRWTRYCERKKQELAMLSKRKCDVNMTGRVLFKQPKVVSRSPRKSGKPRLNFRFNVAGIIKLVYAVNLKEVHLAHLRTTLFWIMFEAILNNQLDHTEFRKGNDLIVRIIKSYSVREGKFVLGGRGVDVTDDDMKLLFGLQGGSAFLDMTP
ncbi:V-type proton ATPase subunit E [Camellia lanceoleosa]|uniref:V-type proton ATPase subunit E n=1 Tax=Camellia lanceoleosa TaxID=1840588 RepID=A0ACC0G0R3_9ERIC|nr:V-type proton ATPase subunit E [Camellia lanceoleosa]